MATKNRKNCPTQDEIFDLWLRKFPLTVYSMGSFRRYEDGIWKETEDELVQREILQVTISLKSKGIRPSASLMSAVTQLAKTNTYKPEDIWDSNPNIIVLQNGTLEIPSRKLRPHSPKDFATEKLTFDFDHLATCPVWLNFLNSRILDAVDFLQEIFGLCLTPIQKFEIALWLKGPSGAGKSTLLVGLQAMCGPKAGVLGLLDLQRSRFNLANLIGKTAVVSTEQPASFLTISPLINQIISGEPIQFELKFKNPIVIIPVAKVIWAMNELPRVASSADGLFRRIKVLEFPPLDPSKIDIDLKEKKIPGEAPGIFNWALEGLTRLLQRGRFDIPRCISDATRDFQESSNIPLLFVQEECELGPAYSVQSSTLYLRYHLWCENNGHKPQSSTTIAEDWKRLGFIRYEKNGCRFWRGVQVKPTVP